MRQARKLMHKSEITKEQLIKEHNNTLLYKRVPTELFILGVLVLVLVLVLLFQIGFIGAVSEHDALTLYNPL